MQFLPLQDLVPTVLGFTTLRIPGQKFQTNILPNSGKKLVIYILVELVRNHQQKHIQLALALGIPLPQNSHEVAATARWAGPPSSVFVAGL